MTRMKIQMRQRCSIETTSRLPYSFPAEFGADALQQEHYRSPTNVRTLTQNSNDQRQGIIMAMVSCLLLFLTAYGILGLVQQIGTCRGEAPPSCCARPFCRLKAPLGLSLLRSTAQTRTFENTSLSAACKKKQGKLWQKERGPDGASPLDRIMRCSKISAAFIAVFKNNAEQNGIFTICSLRMLLRWENRIRQKDKVSAGKIRTRQ